MRKFVLALMLITVVMSIAGCASVRAEPAEVNLTLTAPDPHDFGYTSCAAYDVRYTTDSTLPIDQWTVIPVNLLPHPSPAGTIEYFTIVGLESDTQYFFVAKAVDNHGNWALFWSNIAPKVTTDTQPPNQIIDLR